ncbi:hypothetical protein BH20ACI1_BH20ACI1_10830 [soil metagenome]
MNCEKCLKFIDDFVEGELDEQNAGRINAHIFGCSECADHFEILNREKDLYAHYLLEVEAPKDLWMKFQTKLEAEKDSQTAENFGWFSEWTTNAIGFLRFNPILSGAAMLVLIAVGFGLQYISINNESAAKIEPTDTQLLTAKSDTTDTDKKVNFPSKSEDEKIDFASRKISQTDTASNRKNTARTEEKSVGVKTESAEKRVIIANQKKISEDNKFTEVEKFERLQANNLEKETAKQIEKTELLLRAFRNARFDGNGETFDVAYEKDQAKKLLEKNILLRQSAANFGTFRAEEMLSQIEPYLLDISNLENNPSRKKVLDIKERVKNQNIIAGLQTY